MISLMRSFGLSWVTGGRFLAPGERQLRVDLSRSIVFARTAGVGASRPFAAVVAKGSFGSRQPEGSADAPVNLYNQKAACCPPHVCRVGASVTRFEINRDRNRLS